MENKKSILDQIIMDYKAQEVANFNAVEIINNLFNELSERERDILIRRFGLHGSSGETLESIGNTHNLTRERIRQIETSSIKRLQQLESLDQYINTLKKVILQLLEEHGGLMERNYLLEVLVNFSVGDARAHAEDEMVHKHYLDFLISKLLHNDFELIAASKHFKHAYKLKYLLHDYLEEVAEDLLMAIENTKKILLTKEVVDIMKQLESFEKHKEKIETVNNLDISSVLGGEFFEEKFDLVNANKTLYTILRAAKKIEQNKFGYWGVDNWREIKPRTMNDKIHLILKNYGEPLHFVDIAKQINKIRFDEKVANAATIHNELILDHKYVLVGRGLYGLKEWGYSRGTVADIIEKILNESSNALTRDEIIDKVLEERLVKKATVVLALMNKNKFDKAGGKYRLKSEEGNKEQK